mgnify:CR=1 FL=1
MATEQNPNSNTVVGNADALPEGSNPVTMGGGEPNPREEQLFIDDNTSTSNREGTGTGTSITPAQTTGNQTVGNSGIDPTRLAGELVGDPSQFMGDDMTLANKVEGVDPTTTGTNLDPSNPNYNVDADALNVVGTTGVVDTATDAVSTDARTYEGVVAFDRVAGQDMDAATGEVRDDAIIDASTIEGDADALGEKVYKFATQDISRVIDTSTVSGKILAEKLGEGNYTDAKSTVKGQMDILSAEFIDASGNPKIPTWAAGSARAVSRMMAFKGVTGTAATAAMAQAIIEASLPIANADAKFFQTVTLENLSNKQEATINTANIISKMEFENLDAREVAALNNSKNFMAMDLANLENEQKSNIINNQNRVQSILEDQKVVNAQRLFTADSQNDFIKFYDQLSSNIDMFNTEQVNGMEQFNTSELNSIYQFNSQLENGREQFYKDMQYNIDLSNTKWRQSVALQENEQLFEANARDVQKYSAKKQAQGSTFEALGTVAAAAITFW